MSDREQFYPWDNPRVDGGLSATADGGSASTRPAKPAPDLAHRLGLLAEWFRLFRTDGHENSAATCDEAADAIERLTAAPAPEPVAWMLVTVGAITGEKHLFFTTSKQGAEDHNVSDTHYSVPLYAHPAPVAAPAPAEPVAWIDEFGNVRPIAEPKAPALIGNMRYPLFAHPAPVAAPDAATVDAVMALADEYHGQPFQDVAAFRKARAALRAAVEQIVRERDEAKTFWRLRAERAEQDAARLRELLTEARKHVTSSEIDCTSCADVERHNEIVRASGGAPNRLACCIELGKAIDAAMKEGK